MVTELKDDELININSIEENEVPLFIPFNINEVDAKYSVFEKTISSIEKLLNQNNVNIKKYQFTDKIVYRDNRSIDWVIPTMYLTSSFLINNPLFIGLMTGLISNYIYDIFKGNNSNPKVKTRIIYKDEETKKIFKVDYEGDNSGLKEIGNILDKLNGK